MSTAKWQNIAGSKKFFTFFSVSNENVSFIFIGKTNWHFSSTFTMLWLFMVILKEVLQLTPTKDTSFSLLCPTTLEDRISL